MADKAKKNKKEMTLSVRIAAETKKVIERKAEKSGMCLSDYVRECCLAGISQETEKGRLGEMAVICQEICNYVEAKYSGDDILEGWAETIWEITL